MEQLKIPFPDGKEAESYRYIKDIDGEYIQVKLKDKYNFKKGELVMCMKGQEMIIGYAEVLESDCIMLRHSLTGEKYENTTWLMLNVWSITKASKFRISEYENKCKKHGYQIVKGDKVKYRKYVSNHTLLNPSFEMQKRMQEQLIKINIEPNTHIPHASKKGVMQEIKESFKELLNIK